MAVKKHKLCTILPEGGAPDATPRRSADECATAERVDNVRLKSLVGPLGAPRAAVERLNLWENGRTIRCLFLCGRFHAAGTDDGGAQLRRGTFRQIVLGHVSEHSIDGGA
jgi:hypothetical protein